MRGSYFLILRKSKYNKQYSKYMFNKIVNENNWLLNEFSEKKLKLEDLQTFQKINDIKYISLKNRYEYDLLIESHFTSGFNCLI